MKVNIFEGSRRIAQLLAFVVSVGVLIAVLEHDTYVSIDYRVMHPQSGFVRTDAPCKATNAATHYFTRPIDGGGLLGVNLCLLPMEFGKEKELLVPYKVDNEGMVWGATAYSSEISEYEAQLEERFSLSAADTDWVNKESRKRFWKNLWTVGWGLVTGLIVFWGLVWAIGWIVRGFMGIPRGMDARPPE